MCRPAKKPEGIAAEDFLSPSYSELLNEYRTPTTSGVENYRRHAAGRRRDFVVAGVSGASVVWIFRNFLLSGIHDSACHGQHGKVGGFAVRRTTADVRAVDTSLAVLERGGLLFLYPEGTRSRDGRLGPFKKGVFVMALKAGTPVAPVTIRGSREIQPPGTYAIRPGTVEVIFHEPIPTDRMTRKDADCLMEQTRCLIASGLEEMERLPRGLATG